jgi:hypothetical protein
VFLIFFTGCGILSGTSDHTSGALDDDTVYYNQYFKLKVNIPAGWYINDIDNNNLSTNKDATKYIYSLEKIDNSDFERYYLADISNIVNPNDKNCLDIQFFIDIFPGDEQLYLDNIRDYYSGLYELANESNETINNLEYKLLSYKTYVDDLTYYEDNLVFLDGNNYYNICICYFDGSDGKNTGYDFMKNNFSLSMEVYI